MIDALSVLMVIVGILVAYFSIKLMRLFKGGDLERSWKPMILIPFFMAGVILLEVFDVQILRLRALMFLLVLITVLASLYQFCRFWQRLDA